MTLVVLAAGLGSRYGGLKQLDPITPEGEFIIDFSVYDAIRAGYKKVVFIILEKNYEHFRETIGSRLERHIEVEYAFQEMTLPVGMTPPERKKPWGTAHALISCRGKVDDCFTVINADDFYGQDAFLRIAEYFQSGCGKKQIYHFCMAGYVLSNTLTDNGSVSRGVCSIDDDGFLTNVIERKEIRRSSGGAEYRDGDRWIPIPPESIVSMNCFGFAPEALDYIAEGFERFLRNPDTDLSTGEYYLPTAVKEMLNAGICDVKVLPTSDNWYGVTYREDKPFVVREISKLIDSGIYPRGLWK
ncbi:MAG: nucleotidyltransferase [Clostridiales bacterium]|nr:nucleotidyltransferase [Clostridiales bacterium]